MDIVTGIVVYVLLWWWVFFMALPVGNRSSATPDAGHDPGAPVNPRLGRKALAATGIAAILWLGLWVFIGSDVISIRDWVSGWR